ncbi:5-formyltetrahydrofolate cyclo-ligase [Clostridium sp. CT7]|nr:5-formyltetrahydrofolate cyclo-ligase [Clostridium sp. CT7]
MQKNKRELRQRMLDMRDSLDSSIKSIKDNRIYNKVINSIEYKDATNIFVYVSYQSEVDTHKIINKAIIDGKKVFVPKVISKEKGMEALEIKGLHDLTEGNYGILEPTGLDYIKPQTIDMVLAPGLAFDKKGGRIGYGGGFYDRYMKLISKSTVKIGICYDFQVVEEVIMDSNDVLVDKIITD